MPGSLVPGPVILFRIKIKQMEWAKEMHKNGVDITVIHTTEWEINQFWRDTI